MDMFAIIETRKGVNQRYSLEVVALEVGVKHLAVAEEA